MIIEKAFKNAKNIGVFLCFLAFSFLTFSILNPIVESNAETIIKDYTVGAYTMSMTNTSEVDVTATTNNDQQLFTAENDVIFRNTCPKGATIAISSKNGTNVLADGEGHEILPTAPGSELSDNSWGFSLDNGETWNSVPVTFEDIDPLLIYNSNEAELEDRIIPVLYGFKLSREIPDGTYSNDVMYTLTPDQDCFIYKINWESNGGTIPEGFPEYLNQDDLLDLSALPRPTRDYYDFAGWRVGDMVYTGNETAVDLNLNNAPSIVIETLWTPTIYPIIYNLDGGSAVNETSYNIESDEIVLANPTRHGYTFRGWSGTDLVGDANTLVIIPAGSHGDRYYTANWDTIPYALTYTLNGGSAENIPTYNIETPTFMLQNPARTAYDFIGWSGTGLTGNYNKEVAILTGSTGDRSFEAHWTPTDYTISYSLKGGAAENPTNYNVESNAITLNNPSRGAYDFDGWSGTELTGTTNKSVTIRKGSYGDRAYAANWTPTTYSISYALNGGSASNPTTYNVESGEIAISNPTKANYDFVGWSGTGLTGNNNKNIKIPASSSGNRSYEAHWTPTNYTISYSLKGGSATNPTSYNVETNSFTLTNPTRGQYDFVGWSGTGLTGNNNKSVTIAKGSYGDRSYTANWTPTNYAISYTLNGGSATNPTSYNVETGEITLNNPTKANYDFVGWSGTGLTGNNNKTVKIPAASYGNRSYTANWTPTNYSVSYTLNGGSASGNPTSYNVESNAFTLNNPTRTAYDFVGWSGTGLTGNNNKSVTVAKGSSGNRSYTANWTPTNYTISYTLNGGSATNNTSYNVETNSFTLNNPTRTAYDFVGWSGTGLSGTGNKTVTISKGSTGNRSYTANWTPTTYTITYNLNGGSASNNTTYTIETNSFTLNNPTRANYNFAGWSGTGISGTSTSVTIAKGSSGNRSYTANWTPVQTVWNYDYTGGIQSFTVPSTGTYKLEVWGSQGSDWASTCGISSNCKGGYGGYSTGNISLTAGQVIYIGVGGRSGYNGGGSHNGEGANGGGATHIGKSNAVLKSTAAANVFIVAGGGGGAGHSGDHGDARSANGGAGGGLTGGSGVCSDIRSCNNYGTGGSQTGGGSNGGSYGQGGSGAGQYYENGGGGGGGWYGGGAARGNYNGCGGGGGGSSYIGGVSGGSTTAGARAGNGYARITWVSN